MAWTRRQFLHQSVAAAAVIGFPQVAAPSVRGANDALRVGSSAVATAATTTSIDSRTRTVSW